MDNELGEHDPFRGMKRAEDEVRPDFWGEDESKNGAKKSLSNAEESAESTEVGKSGKGGLYKAKDAESKTGLYSGGKKGDGEKESLKDEAAKGKFKDEYIKKGPLFGAILSIFGVGGLFIKKGPLFGIILSIFVIGGLMCMTQFFELFDVVEQFQETFNSMHTSVNNRTNKFFYAQMENGRVKKPTKGSRIFGETFKISKSQNEKLKAKGIEFDEKTFKNSKGKPIKVLKYDDGSGEIKIVTADQESADALNKQDLSKYSTDDMKYSKEAVTFDKLYTSDTNFFHNYNSGSVTWKGVVANWFGTNTKNFLTNNKITRNLFQDFRKKVAEFGGDTLKATKDTLAEKTGTVKEAGVRSSDKGAEDSGKNGETEGGNSMNRTELDEASIKAKMNKLSAKFNKAANIGCAVMGLIGAANLMVVAAEAGQILDITSAYFETSNKVKYGLDYDSPVHDLSNSLIQKITGTYEEVELDKSQATGQVTEDGIPGVSNVTITTNPRSAMESQGIAALYGLGNVSPADPSVKSFNIMESSNKILGGLSLSVESFEGCLAAKAAASIFGAVKDTAEVAACVLTGVGCALWAVDALVSMGVGVGVGLVLQGVVKVLSPIVVKYMTRDLVTNLSGEDLGNAIASGANMYQGGAHRASGGMLSDRSHLEQFALEKQKTIAENAKQERLDRSPFDARSKYTFMGTLMSQLMVLNTSDSLVTTITNGGKAVSNSLIAMSPSASAYNVAKVLLSDDEYKTACPYMASIGAVGDSFCNPYITTDLDTMETDPADVIDAVDKYGGLADGEASDGNVVIKEDSTLAKFIRYCGNRTSSFGIADANIANEIGDFGTISTGVTAVDGAANGAIGGTPVIGDIFEIAADGVQAANLGFITGESCVAGNKQPAFATSSPSWKEGKYYQRFIEDQSLSESMGLVEKSAVTAYLEKYYEENPLDDSYEGTLARYSGLDKETVTDMLSVVDYYNYIANYDSSDRYAFGAPLENPEGDKGVKFDDEYLLAGGAILLHEIEYRDVRNRVVTV